MVRSREGIVFCLISLMLCAGVSQELSADMTSSVSIDLRNSFYLNPDPDSFEFSSIASGLSRLTFTSTGNRNVRAHFSLQAQLGAVNLLTVDRAYIRSRLGPLRMTVGRNRVSWGEGLVFNAADVLMGASDLNLDLTSTEFRSSSRFMGLLYLPLGRLAFLETAVLPAMPDEAASLTALVSGTPLPEVDPADTAVGIRSSLTLEQFLGLKLEGGYLYSGEDERHQSYLSLQGGQGLNWHLSSSLSLGSDSFGGTADNFFQSLLVSGGIYSLNSIGESASFGTRAEILYKYSGDFIEQEPVSDADYGLFAYYEMSLGLGRNLNLYSRNILSPVDGSVLGILGADFTPFQGTAFYLNLMFKAGDADDIFSHYSTGGYGLLTGIRYTF